MNSGGDILREGDLLLQQWGIEKRRGDSLRGLGYPSTSCIVERVRGVSVGVDDSANDAVVNAVDKIINQMGESYQTVCVLYYIKSLSLKIICEMLHCKITQVRDILKAVQGCVYSVSFSENV